MNSQFYISSALIHFQCATRNKWRDKTKKTGYPTSMKVMICRRIQIVSATGLNQNKKKYERNDARRMVKLRVFNELSRSFGCYNLQYNDGWCGIIYTLQLCNCDQRQFSNSNRRVRCSSRL